MIHELYLHDEPFKQIKYGTKRIEMRLNDEKRKLIKVNDQIKFTNRTTNEELIVDVVDITQYSSFKELYEKNDKKLLGYKDDEVASPTDMSKYYSEEQINKYGVLAIRIRRID